LAHPLDEFYQVTYITVAPQRVTLKIELYPGVLVAPQLLTLIDADQDDDISAAEAQAYVEQFVQDLTFEIDGRATPLRATTLDFPPVLAIRAGQAVIRFDLYADFSAALAGNHRLFYQNNHQPETGTYVVNAIAESPERVQITAQDRDMLQTSIQLDYTVSPNGPDDEEAVETPIEVELPSGISAGQEQLNRYLYEPELSPFFLMVALGLSVVLGGLHALTPGHGKTLVAAYLIGSRGTVGHAVALGGIVTFTHTASVIVIGLLALLASQFIVPNVLAPTLEILSGLLVVYLGVRLLWTRWGAHSQTDDYHSHHHSEHDHHHHHHHDLPEQVKMSDLLTLGISGGLVPCPEALGIMLIAIGLNRISFGLGLVVAFSFGLAAILIIIGVLLVRSKSLLDGVGRYGEHWQTVLPLVSAIIVTLLGLGIVAKGLLPYFL
jgi:ABC-type nickel/cobalt efflux system permease component RcnA